MARILLRVAFYIGLVVWLTWPLARHAATHLPASTPPCAYDLPYMAAVLAHESRSLVAGGAGFSDLGIYRPAPNSLYYGETGFGALPYFAPVFLATGNPALAINLLFIGCVALSAAALHSVAQGWTGSELAGLVAGTTLLTTRWVLWKFIPGAPSYAVLQYFPYLIALAALPPRNARAALALAGIALLQCLTNVVYVAAAVVAPLTLLGLMRLFGKRSRVSGGWTLVAVGLAAVLLVLVDWAHLQLRLQDPLGAGRTRWHVGDVPFPTLLPWALRGSLAPTAVPPTALALVALGVLARWRSSRRGRVGATREAWLHAAFWAAVGCYISLTPVVFFGKTLVLLFPQAWLVHASSVYQVVRVPSRLGVASLIGAALLAGIGFAECARWIGHRQRSTTMARGLEGALAFAAVATMYATYATGRAALGQHTVAPLLPSYPLSEAITGDSPTVKALERTQGPLIEVPATIQGTISPEFNARAMYRAIFHRHPLLNGYSGYWPSGFRERMALAEQMPDPEAVRLLAQDTGLAYVLVHFRDLPGRLRGKWLLAELLPRSDLRLVLRDGDDLLFAVSAVDRPSLDRDHGP